MSPSAVRPSLPDSLQLARGHFAAVRAWIQGLPVDLIASRYLGYSTDDHLLPDARLIKVELADILGALVERAERHGLQALAKALATPWTSDTAARRAVQAVHDLERCGEPTPDPKHAVSLWFAPAFARRLQAASIGTVGELAEFCNDYGASFWRRIPRIGVKAGGQILAWCRRHEKSLGVALGAHVTGEKLPVPAPTVAIEIRPGIARVPPLEVVTVPAYCTGSQAPNRADPELAAIGARTDLEAIQTYLSLRPVGSHTWRARRKELERFFAWAVIERGKPLSALKTEDCIAYRDFLRNPVPADRWCGKMVSRALPGWRPFQGPLSPVSRKHALTILRHFCEWLVRKQYWRVNPWLDVPADAAPEPRIQTEKALSAEAWERFSDWLQRQAKDPGARRLRTAAAAIILLRDTGMRLAEASLADRSAALPFPDNSLVWGELRVLGKRNRIRDVTLSHAAIAMLRM
ncbi:MAG: phage integrase family protein, partial [Noviherbaspirillum sp.]|nr:phage integrase family protein [Noviherbaspirillum sp.]